MSGNPPAVRCRGLTRYFGAHRVVDRLTADFPTGRVTALLGLNGAGKTTTLRMLMGLLAPTRGTAEVLRCDASSMTPRHLARIGYVVEGHYLPGWMRASDVESFCRRYRPSWDDRRFADILDHFAVDPRQRCGRISRGQRAGVSLASVLAATPELLILDDPSLGLDPVSRRSLSETLLEYVGGGDRRGGGGSDRTVILSTHQLDDVERIADDVAVMLGGRLCVHTDLNDFQSRVTRFRLDAADRTAESIDDAVGTSARGVVERRRVADGWVVTVVDADEGFASAVASRLSVPVEPMPTALNDRVIAYLSRERQRRGDPLSPGGPGTVPLSGDGGTHPRSIVPEVEVSP